MKKELTMTDGYMWRSRIESVKQIMDKWLVCLSNYYSKLLEEDITPKQTGLLLMAQLTAFLVIFPCQGYIFFRLICLVWFYATVKLYRESFRK